MTVSTNNELVIKMTTKTCNADRLALLKMLPYTILGMSEKNVTEDVIENLKVHARFHLALMPGEFD